VVSNNARNRMLRDCLAVRITTSPKPEMASVAVVLSADPFVGRVLCDDIVAVFHDELRRDVGALSTATMDQVAAGLRDALHL